MGGSGRRHISSWHICVLHSGARAERDLPLREAALAGGIWSDGHRSSSGVYKPEADLNKKANTERPTSGCKHNRRRNVKCGARRRRRRFLAAHHIMQYVIVKVYSYAQIKYHFGRGKEMTSHFSSVRRLSAADCRAGCFVPIFCFACVLRSSLIASIFIVCTLLAAILSPSLDTSLPSASMISA